MVRLPAVLSALVLNAIGNAASASAHGGDAHVDCTGVNAVGSGCGAREASHSREFFYVGGQSAPDPSGNITTGQIYVEKLTPIVRLRPTPLVFLHGGGVSATTWLNTPDNRPGWASYFLGKGYQLYLVDANGIGRSAANDPENFSMNVGMSDEFVEMGFTAVKAYSTYPQSRLHTQWPGTGMAGDAVFDQFQQSFTPYTSSYASQELAIRAAGCELLSLIGARSYLVSHSLGSKFALVISNDCPQHLAGSINLEPSTIPFWAYGYGLGGSPANPWGLTNTRVDYEPAVADAAELQSQIESVGAETLAKRNCYRQREPARQLPNISSVPYVALTGEASVHITYDHCIIDYLEQVGGRPEWIRLSDKGIRGNGHFGHVEKNNLDIAAVVHDWIKQKQGWWF
ncbi:putative secreted lipase [Colletotrichum orbiculare MAFF 240422]|uniref:Secreted lipase n=1 Tax=Colletotrichum orbiculare (strain 104-T / ATCC 96160 / CBS 514.97 / LARS 414 / MAFF 240422) TaxID=1213857 RepID=N4VEU2_COLOR|nr:putative secreted lipase [Colletotrichum orbiculare MAFF 240422]